MMDLMTAEDLAANVRRRLFTVDEVNRMAELGILGEDEPVDSERHPGGREALLVIEIARTSTQLDQRKARIYASAGVPIYWLVDLAARRLEVFSSPLERAAFEESQVLGPDDEVELPSLGVRWTVADIVR